VIDAWSRQKEQLIIVGTGSQEEVLKKRARGKNIKFQSRLSDEELQKLYMCAQCLIMPQKEDYGYIALEAQACGCPVVAYGHGGARETVTFGVFFAEQTEDALCDALEKCRKLQYNPDTYENSHIRGRSRNTFVAAFSQKITKAV
jgi:glycosyltransferase involved in cell wall biosynthesis